MDITAKTLVGDFTTLLKHTCLYISQAIKTLYGKARRLSKQAEKTAQAEHCEKPEKYT